MSLEQYQLAKQYFDKTKDYSPYVGFVKKLNLAKWNGLQDNKAEFYKLQEQISNLVDQFPMFQPIWEELQLDFLTKWNDQTRLLAFITKNYNGWNDNDIPEDVVATAMNVKSFLTSNATLAKTNDGSFKKRDSVFQYIYDYVFPAIFSDYPNVITTQTPDNVINKDAFII